MAEHDDERSQAIGDPHRPERVAGDRRHLLLAVAHREAEDVRRAVVAQEREPSRGLADLPSVRRGARLREEQPPRHGQQRHRSGETLDCAAQQPQPRRARAEALRSGQGGDLEATRLRVGDRQLQQRVRRRDGGGAQGSPLLLAQRPKAHGHPVEARVAVRLVAAVDLLEVAAQRLLAVVDAAHELCVRLGQGRRRLLGVHHEGVEDLDAIAALVGEVPEPSERAIEGSLGQRAQRSHGLVVRGANVVGEEPQGQSHVEERGYAPELHVRIARSRLEPLESRDQRLAARAALADLREHVVARRPLEEEAHGQKIHEPRGRAVSGRELWPRREPLEHAAEAGKGEQRVDEERLDARRRQPDRIERFEHAARAVGALASESTGFGAEPRATRHQARRLAVQDGEHADEEAVLALRHRPAGLPEVDVGGGPADERRLHERVEVASQVRLHASRQPLGRDRSRLRLCDGLAGGPQVLEDGRGGAAEPESLLALSVEPRRQLLDVVPLVQRPGARLGLMKPRLGREHEPPRRASPRQLDPRQREHGVLHLARDHRVQVAREDSAGVVGVTVEGRRAPAARAGQVRRVLDRLAKRLAFEGVQRVVVDEVL